MVSRVSRQHPTPPTPFGKENVVRAVVASTPTSLNKTPPPQGGCGALFTPANPVASFSPPSDVRRESLLVPPSANLLRLAKGSGVSVFRVDRSPVPQKNAL